MRREGKDTDARARVSDDVKVYCYQSALHLIPTLLFFSPQLSLAHENGTGMAHSTELTTTITVVLRVQYSQRWTSVSETY